MEALDGVLSMAQTNVQTNDWMLNSGGYIAIIETFILCEKKS